MFAVVVNFKSGPKIKVKLVESISVERYNAETMVWDNLPKLSITKEPLRVNPIDLAVNKTEIQSMVIADSPIQGVRSLVVLDMPRFMYKPADSNVKRTIKATATLTDETDNKEMVLRWTCIVGKDEKGETIFTVKFDK
jgi:hypothetical protein